MSGFSVRKDKVLNNLKATSTLKVPRFPSLSALGNEPGFEGNVIVNRENGSLCYHDGSTWQCILGGGGFIAQTLFLEGADVLPYITGVSNVAFTGQRDLQMIRIGDEVQFFLRVVTTGNPQGGLNTCQIDFNPVGLLDVGTLDNPVGSGSVLAPPIDPLLPTTVIALNPVMVFLSSVAPTTTLRFIWSQPSGTSTVNVHGVFRATS